MSLSKLQLNDSVDKLAHELIELGTQLFNNPELGFKEHKTKQIMWDKLSQIPTLKLVDNLAITGFSAELHNPDATHTIALIAEMDAVYQPQHFCAASDGASHCCGHDSQMVIMYAVIKVLAESGIKLPFNLRLIFTPAEEFLDLDYRLQLQKSGVIKYLSGKQELLSRGVFNDVDLVISCHSLGGNPKFDFDLATNLVGFIIKRAKFIGKSAHAGAAPEQGINALNAASLALSAIAYSRETFPNQDYIRVSPIIKPNNWAASVIPESAEVEMYIRAANIAAIENTTAKVDNCLRGAALAVGCQLEINNLMGYFPLLQHPELTALAIENASKLTQESRIDKNSSIVAASGDVGDLSLLMPTIQIGYGGYRGTIHGVDFKVSEPQQIYQTTAKLVLGMLHDLMQDGAALVSKITDEFEPISLDEYHNIIRRLSHAE
jgi:amidohydrolase